MAPWKCPDCGIWWAGLEHRCPPPRSATTTNRPPASITVVCNCTYDEHGRRRISTATCPIHDYLITYTGWGGI